jgi:hypothetical protein
MLRFGGGDKGWNTGIVPLVVELDKGSKGIFLWLTVRPEAQFGITSGDLQEHPRARYPGQSHLATRPSIQACNSGRWK